MKKMGMKYLRAEICVNWTDEGNVQSILCFENKLSKLSSYIHINKDYANYIKITIFNLIFQC